MVLAACGEAPVPEEYTHCYTYDFAGRDFTYYPSDVYFGYPIRPGYAEPELVWEMIDTEVGPQRRLVDGGYYNASMTLGSWISDAGFLNDGSNNLNVRFWAIPTYTPARIPVLEAVIELTVPSIVDIQATGHIFGLPVGIDESYVGEAGVVQFTISDLGNFAYEEDIEIELQASSTIAIRSVTIYQIDTGEGRRHPNLPNPCGPPPTPTNTVPPTGTNTFTPTPGITTTDTLTPTPTPTTWEWEWNNEDGVCGFVARESGYGEWDSGGGTGFKRVSNTSNPDGIYMVNTSVTFTTATTITYYYYRITPASSGVYTGRAYFFGGSSSPVNNLQSQNFGGGLTGQEWYPSGGASFNGYFGVGFDPRNDGVHPNGMWAIDKIVLQGTGTNPFAGFYCNAPTATPTPTPTPTRTHTPTVTPLFGGGATATRTHTRTPLPAVLSPTPVTVTSAPPSQTPVATNTPQPTQTLIPLPTAIPSQTTEATYPVPGFTAAPGATLAGTMIPVGTIEGVGGHSDVVNLLSTAVVEVNNLPGSIRPYVPNPDVTPLLGYVKYFLSCTSIYEALGENVGSMACHSVVGLSLIVILSVVFFSLRIVTLVMKFAVWIIGKIVKAIPFFG